MLNWGIIGLGAIAQEFAQSMNTLHPIYAASSRDFKRAQEFQSIYQVQHIYENYEEMLKDKNIDVVYIATVNSQHLSNIWSCLLHGKHVLCEKAIWHDIAELKAAYTYAKQHHLLLCEAMTIYHMPLFTKIESLIEEGKLGKIKFIQADLGSLKEDDPSNRFFCRELGGGAMLDIGTYVLSFLRFFQKGSIKNKHHVMAKYTTGVDEMWSISMEEEQGVLANANMTFRAKLPKRAVVAGDKAYVTIYNYVRAEEAIIQYPDGSSESLHVGETKNALCYEIQDIEDAITHWGCGKDHMDKTIDVVTMMDELLTVEGLK